MRKKFAHENEDKQDDRFNYDFEADVSAIPHPFEYKNKLHLLNQQKRNVQQTPVEEQDMPAELP